MALVSLVAGWLSVPDRGTVMKVRTVDGPGFIGKESRAGDGERWDEGARRMLLAGCMRHRTELEAHGHINRPGIHHLWGISHVENLQDGRPRLAVGDCLLVKHCGHALGEKDSEIAIVAGTSLEVLPIPPTIQSKTSEYSQLSCSSTQLRGGARAASRVLLPSCECVGNNQDTYRIT